MTSPKLLKSYRNRITVTKRERESLGVRRIHVSCSEGVPCEFRIGDESIETTIVDRGLYEHHEHPYVYLPKMKEMPKGTTVPLTQGGTGEYKLSLA